MRRDNIGADIVSVGMRSPSYPPELLRKQLIDLGHRLGGQGARGVTVTRDTFRPGDPSATVVKGSCGVDGLIDRTNGRLFVAPIAQAFAGAPEPNTIRRILVSFDGEVPGNRTLQRASNPGLAFTARVVGSSVEYDVELRSQDPAQLIVDEGDGPRPPATPAKPKSAFDPLTVTLVAAAVAAAGALVYCLLLMLGRRPAAKS
ncbi:hypothetical protein EON82_12520 [bacterium]|nr:MAG: hypothetical protein EON82_12520 [bacterium]